MSCGRKSALPQPARDAGEPLDQVPGDRPARLLQGRRGQPVRHSRLQLPHAHRARRRGSSSIFDDGTWYDIAVPEVADRSAEIPRRAPLHRPPEGRAHQDQHQRRGEARLTASSTACR